MLSQRVLISIVLANGALTGQYVFLYEFGWPCSSCVTEAGWWMKMQLIADFLLQVVTRIALSLYVLLAVKIMQ